MRYTLYMSFCINNLILFLKNHDATRLMQFNYNFKVKFYSRNFIMMLNSVNYFVIIKNNNSKTK